MESFQEQTCDFSMSYGMTPDVCRSIVFSENQKSKCQKMLEIKRLKCAKLAASQKCIPKEKLMTHDQWMERQAKCKDSKPLFEEEMLKCAKKIQEISLKHNYKKCPFMTNLPAVLEKSDEHKESMTSECCDSGFDELMLKCLHAFQEEGEEEDEEEESDGLSEGSEVHKEEDQACSPPTPSLLPAPPAEAQRQKKAARGLKKLWKRFHALCEQSTSDPLQEYYNPGATPTDLPLFM